jgi:hypothetical protein
VELPLLQNGCRFPGSDAAYDALTECCDVRLLAEAIVFTSTNPAAANAIFNVSNGDVFRWNEVRLHLRYNTCKRSLHLAGSSHP